MPKDEKKKCRAVAGISREQCKNSKLPGSPYCWHHQAWKTTLIGSTLSLLFGFFINVVSTKYTEKAPRLFPSLNWQQLASDTVFVYPTNLNYPNNAQWVDFNFWVHNAGEMDANGMFMRLTVHSYISNFINAPKWNVEEAGGFGFDDQIQVVLDQRGDRPIPPNFGAKFQPFSLNSAHIKSLGGFCTYGAIGAETKRSRIHIFFDNPPDMTNVYRGVAAREYLSKIDPKIAANPDTVMMQYILDTTNDARILKKSVPWGHWEMSE